MGRNGVFGFGVAALLPVLLFPEPAPQLAAAGAGSGLLEDAEELYSKEFFEQMLATLEQKQKYAEEQYHLS